MSDDIVTIIRWINVILSGVGLVWLGTRCIRRWRTYPYSYRLTYLTLSFYIFGVFEGTLEGLLDDAAQHIRVLITLVANLALLTTLALTQPERRTVFDPDVEVRRGL
jgi:hypothetical protein